MRTFLLLLLLVLLGSAAHAQDLLTKRNGEEIAVKVVEITPAEVRYRRADNPDGPLISVWKSDVFMIRYANGSKEVLNAAPAVAPGTSAAAPAGPPATVGGVPVVNNQSPDDAILEETIHLDGPRVGFTILTPGVLSKAQESIPDLNPFLTQFGWQFETRLFRLPNGLSGLVEFVPLVGGLEQGKFLPSLSGLLGIRGAKGFEVGMGPNVTPLGANLVLAVGSSFHSGGINFPVNLAVVPGNGGARVSLMIGFNARHR
ncbi:hypothetical protein [Hymenobacter rubidus]|uniref:hypothetical protein n=1 Tax=Hymenobacter rubidus TaxID=1441626 RepID=UPI00191FE13C|nr:hypothetical protein [Hymenobacter rubidus]